MFGKRLIFMLFVLVSAQLWAEEPPPEEDPNPCIEDLEYIEEVIDFGGFTVCDCGKEDLPTYYYIIPLEFPVHVNVSQNCGACDPLLISTTFDEASSSLCDDSEPEEDDIESCPYIVSTGTESFDVEDYGVYSIEQTCTGIVIYELDDEQSTNTVSAGTEQNYCYTKLAAQVYPEWIGLDATDAAEEQGSVAVRTSLAASFEGEKRTWGNWSYSASGMENADEVTSCGSGLVLRAANLESVSSSYQDKTVTASLKKVEKEYDYVNHYNAPNCVTEKRTAELKDLTDTVEFTVVKVDVDFSGTDEDDEESLGTFVKANGLYSVQIGITPSTSSFPYDAKNIALSGPQFYSANELIDANKIDSIENGGEVFFYVDAPGEYEITATHDASGAVDKAKVTVVDVDLIVKERQGETDTWVAVSEEKEETDGAVVAAVEDGIYSAEVKLLPSGLSENRVKLICEDVTTFYEDEDCLRPLSGKEIDVASSGSKFYFKAKVGKELILEAEHNKSGAKDKAKYTIFDLLSILSKEDKLFYPDQMSLDVDVTHSEHVETLTWSFTEVEKCDDVAVSVNFNPSTGKPTTLSIDPDSGSGQVKIKVENSQPYCYVEKTFDINLCDACQSGSCSAESGSVDAEVCSVDLKFSLGQDSRGRSAGHLALKGDVLSDFAQSSALEFVGSDLVDIFHDDTGNITQVLTDHSLVDVAPDASIPAFWYIKFYDRPSTLTFDAVTSRYTFDPRIVAEVTVTVDQTSASSLVITRTADGFDQIYSYALNNGVWVLTDPDGLSEELVESINGSEKIKTRTTSKTTAAETFVVDRTVETLKQYQEAPDKPLHRPQ